MSDANKKTAGLGPFGPSLDFFQNLVTGAAQSASSGIPNLGAWVAPTLSVEEIDKRIKELKTVQYWLEQNVHAIRAAIQGLEVQRLTLTTLENLNVSMNELARVFAVPSAPASTPQAVEPGWPLTATRPLASPASEEPPSPHAHWPLGPAGSRTASTLAEPAATSAPAAPAAGAPAVHPVAQMFMPWFPPIMAPAAPVAAPAEPPPPAVEAEPASQAAHASSMGDSVAWWGSLAQQFQNIAGSAMSESAPRASIPSFEDMIVKRASAPDQTAKQKAGEVEHEDKPARKSSVLSGKSGLAKDGPTDDAHDEGALKRPDTP